MTAPDHVQIYERVGVLEAKMDSHQTELAEFKQDSKEHRKKSREDMETLTKDMSVVVDWVKEEKTRRRLIKKALKAFAWFLGLVATGVAIFKGVR